MIWLIHGLKIFSYKIVQPVKGDCFQNILEFPMIYSFHSSDNRWILEPLFKETSYVFLSKFPSIEDSHNVYMLQRRAIIV